MGIYGNNTIDPGSGEPGGKFPAPGLGSGAHWFGPDRHTTWPPNLESQEPADHGYDVGEGAPSHGDVPVNIVRSQPRAAVFTLGRDLGRPGR